MRIIPLILLLLPVTLQAFPVETSIGWGLGHSWTKATFDEPVIQDLNLNQIRVPSYSSVKNQDLPWNIYAGFRFHPNYGFELGYLDYGSINFQKNISKSNTAGESTGSVSRDATISTQGFYISHVLYFNIVNKLQLQAKAGLIFGDNKHTEVGSFTIINNNDSETTDPENFNSSTQSFVKGQLALSLLYEYQKNWRMRLQVNQIKFDHPTENEKFSQWFTGFSIERKL
jgi:hypothetical protein